jgi:hypothetical protein
LVAGRPTSCDHSFNTEKNKPAIYFYNFSQL